MPTTSRLGIDIIGRDKTAAAFASVKRSMSGFASVAKSMAGAFAAGGAIVALAGIGKAVGSAIDHMDDLGKSAQKIGIPVEELSKLEYAARLADVPLAGLEGSVKKLSKAMGELAGGGKNDAGAAFKALGISISTASGQLRPASDVMGDVAARFAGMQDGAGKTALAMAIFGRAGADMIPLLNGGREAISGASAELAQFGGVVTPEAARQAEAFNDNLTRLKAAGEGLTQQLAQAMLPTLVDVTDGFVEMARTGDAVEAFSSFVKSEMEGIAAGARTTMKEIYALVEAYRYMRDATANAVERFNGPLDPAKAGLPRLDLGGGASVPNPDYAVPKVTVATPEEIASINAYAEALREMNEAVAPFSAGNPVKSKPEFKIDAPFMLAETKTAADDATKAFEKLKAAGQSVWEQTRTPLEAYQLEIRNLNNLLGQGVIDQDTYGRAIASLQDGFAEAAPAAKDFASTMGDLAGSGASSVLDTLGQLAGGTLTVADAFASLRETAVSALQDIIKLMLNKALMGFLSGGVAPSQQGGGFLDAFAGFFAGGGRLGAGQWGFAGENGMEPVVGPARIISNRDLMPGSGGGADRVIVHNYPGGEVSKRERRNESGGVTTEIFIRKQMERQAPEVNRKTIPGAYGLSPALTNR